MRDDTGWISIGMGQGDERRFYLHATPSPSTYSTVESLLGPTVAEAPSHRETVVAFVLRKLSRWGSR